jgi:hypothetical protein
MADTWHKHVTTAGRVDIPARGLTGSHLRVSLCGTTNDAFVRTQRLTGEVELRGTLDDEELREWMISSRRAVNSSTQ